MATKNTDSDSGYSRVSTGLGKKIQFGDEEGQLTEFEGVFVGSGVYEDEKNDEKYAYFQFKDVDNPELLMFCWQTHELKVAMGQIGEGQTVKIVYQGSDAVDVGRVKKFAVYVKN